MSAASPNAGDEFSVDDWLFGFGHDEEADKEVLLASNWGVLEAVDGGVCDGLEILEGCEKGVVCIENGEIGLVCESFE